MSVNHPLCSPPTRETHPSLEWTSTPAEGDVKAASSCLTANFTLLWSVKLDVGAKDHGLMFTCLMVQMLSSAEAER